MASNYRDWNGVLNQLAGLPPGTLDATGAANHWAGLPPGTLELIGALNYKNGTYANGQSRGLLKVCRELAGLALTVNGLDALGALNHLAGNSPG
jgi:hypothetical protein